MKPSIFFLINSIEIDRGGLTKASLKQATLFAEMGYKTYMLTFNWNPNYPLIRKQLQVMGKVHKNVIIRNMYEELAEPGKPVVISDTIMKKPMNDLTKGLPFDKRDNHNAYRTYKNGLYHNYISLNEDNSLNFIDFFNENRYRTKRESYDQSGIVRKVTYMDILKNKPRQVVYFNKEGRAYLTEWINPKNNEIQRIILYDKSSVKKVYVEDKVALKVDWLHSVIDKEMNKSVIVSDTRSTDKIITKLEHPDAAKIWRLHSNHLCAPYTNDSELRPGVTNAIMNLDNFDVALFLTDEQKKDFEKRTKKRTNFIVIPHYQETKINFIQTLINKPKKDTNLAVIVSRLVSSKRLDHAIMSFKTVTEKQPNVRLEIWGSGPEEKNLNKLIKELNLESNVFLKGYTQNPNLIYQKGLFSILTSETEGFALSILECMANKTPVVSYDIKYGPDSMIINKHNSFLVQDGNIGELANKMIEMFDSPNKAIRMGNNAKKYVDKFFNKTNYKNKWLETIDLAMISKFGE